MMLTSAEQNDVRKRNAADPDGEPDELGYGALYALAEQHRDAALLHFAHSSGLFEWLRESRTVAETARYFEWVPRKVTVLLSALTALKLAVRDDNKYHNSMIVNEFLIHSAQGYIGSYLEILRHQWNVWQKLPEIMASEGHVAGQQVLDDGDAAFIALFQAAMSEVCDEDVDALVELPVWNPTDHVLDFGGGHGLYLATLARRFPKLTGEVWDLPSAERAALQMFARLGVSDRLKFVAVDLRRPPKISASSGDVIMINHCLHHLTPDDADKLLRYAALSLRPRGRLIVIEQNLARHGDAPIESALFSFYLMTNNAEGQLHSAPWIEDVMKATGLDVETRACGWENEDVLIIGKRSRASAENRHHA
jgi:SAM-dependent methyltransferase